MLSPTIACNIEQVTALQESLLLKFSELFDFTTALMAFPVALWALRHCMRPTRFHINFRMIGGVHCICLMIHCAGRVIQNGSAVYLWLGKLSLCEKRMHYGTCLTARLLNIFGLYSSSLTASFMCIERTIATKFYKKYEKKNWFLGVFLIFLQFLISFLITLGYYENSVLDDRPSFCFLDISREWAYCIETLMICANILGFCQCRRLNRINTCIRKKSNTIALGQKFQIEENKMVIRIMDQFNMMAFVSLITFFTFGGLQLGIRNLISVPTFFAVFELLHCVPVYAIIMLTQMMKSIARLRAKQSQQIIKIVQTKDDAYFQYLKKEWM